MATLVPPNFCTMTVTRILQAASLIPFDQESVVREHVSRVYRIHELDANLDHRREGEQLTDTLTTVDSATS